MSLIALNYQLDLRRLIIARGPLAVSDSFQVLIRVVLARLLGIRMCPDCPACMKSKKPCMNAYGSNAEPQGGVFGRADALFATVEYQRSGPPHAHMFVFLQRAHQHKSMMELGEMLKSGLLNAEALKTWQDYVCRETYPDIEKQAAEKETVEKQLPALRTP